MSEKEVRERVFEARVLQECSALASMLVEKNRAYGDSALNPVRAFSKADPVEQLRVRIDDKLSRLMRGSEAGEDVVLDLLGYLVLLRIATRKLDLKMPEGWNDPRQEPHDTDGRICEDERDSALLGCEIAYRREPTQAEGDAHELPRGDGVLRECHVPMGDHHGHRCSCGKWVWGGPTVCQRCTDATAVKLRLESFDLERRLRADAQANLDIEKKAHEITRGMLEACAKRLVSQVETIRQREQEHLEACAEADELRAEREALKADFAQINIKARAYGALAQRFKSALKSIVEWANMGQIVTADARTLAGMAKQALEVGGLDGEELAKLDAAMTSGPVMDQLRSPDFWADALARHDTVSMDDAEDRRTLAGHLAAEVKRLGVHG